MKQYENELIRKVCFPLASTIDPIHHSIAATVQNTVTPMLRGHDLLDKEKVVL
jgi:hypothetical protein